MRKENRKTGVPAKKKICTAGFAQVLSRKKYLAIGIFFAAFYAFLYASIAKPEWADYAMWVQASEYWLLVMWVFSSLLVGIVAAGQAYLFERRKAALGTVAQVFAGAFAAIAAGVACGCSASIAFALIGSLGVLGALLLQWKWAVGTLSACILLYAACQTQKEIGRGNACSIKKGK